jgi:hypothetical protein
MADRADIIGMITPEMESLAAAWVREPRHKEAIYHLWISKGRCPSQDTVHVTTKKEKPAGGKYTYAGEVRARSAQVAKSIARVWALRDSYLGKYLPEDI